MLQTYAIVFIKVSFFAFSFLFCFYCYLPWIVNKQDIIKHYDIRITYR